MSTMSKAQCRLCLCPTASQPGIPSSIKDDSFEAIIKNVLRFALPTFNIVAGKKNDLPVLVCFQCSNIVRNFHYFSEHVKANQTKLRFISVENQPIPNQMDDTKSKSDDAATNSLGTNDNQPPVSARTNNEGSSSDIGENPSDIESNQPHKCVAKVELVETLEKMDNRVNAVTKKLGILIEKLAHSRPLPRKRRIEVTDSFKVSPLSNVEELDTFCQQLNDEEYKRKVKNWFNSNISASDSDNRMHQSMDLLFTRAFLPEFTWTGRSRIKQNRKLAFRNYTNIVDLIQSLGNTDTETVTYRELEYFLTKKLSHAKDRLNITRKTSCHVRPFNKKKSEQA